MNIFRRLEEKTPAKAVTIQLVTTIISIILASLAVFGVLPASTIEDGSEVIKEGVSLTSELFNKLKGMSRNELIMYVVGFVLAQLINVGAGMQIKK